MRSVVFPLSTRHALAIALACLSAGLPLSASAGTYTNFNYPGAYSTVVYGINKSGVSVGSYGFGIGPTWAYGFIRQSNGNLTSIIVPGVHATLPSAINGPGKVVGFYEDANYVLHGFLYNAAGQFTTLNAPGAGSTKSYTGTLALSINDAARSLATI
jgi:hypothetical protein